MELMFLPTGPKGVVNCSQWPSRTTNCRPLRAPRPLPPLEAASHVTCKMCMVVSPMAHEWHENLMQPSAGYGDGQKAHGRPNGLETPPANRRLDLSKELHHLHRRWAFDVRRSCQKGPVLEKRYLYLLLKRPKGDANLTCARYGKAWQGQVYISESSRVCNNPSLFLGTTSALE